MKLVYFAVNNFRCISGGLENNSIKFDDNNTTFIFGQNNVGKSSFLRAYESFYNGKIVPDDFTFPVSEGSPVNDIEVEVWLHIDETVDKERIDALSNNKFDSLKAYLDNGILKVKRVTSKASSISSKNTTYDPSISDWADKSYGSIGLDNVFQSMIPKPLFIHAMPTEDQVKSVVNDILKEMATSSLTKKENEQLKLAQEVINALQDKVYDRATINAYEDQVNEKFCNLFDSYKIKIDEGTSRVKYTQDKFGKDFEIDFVQNETNQSTNYAKMGHGAVRMAIFLLMLMRDKLQGDDHVEKSYLVLFEEPELFLHPKLTKKLRQLVYEVSKSDTPFQILCASHSPQMIDLTKDHSSIVRMTKNCTNTQLNQVLEKDLVLNDTQPIAEVKQKLYEILRFNPFICESFYADEIVLVEGDTEAIIWRAYLQEFPTTKDIFVVNCGSCNNIPFYQKIFSKFKIPYSVICDTDHTNNDKPIDFWDGKYEEPKFTGYIQKSISDQFLLDKTNSIAKKFFVFAPTFEPFHTALSEPYKYISNSEGKAVGANEYWEKLLLNKASNEFNEVPIVKYIKAILE